MQNFNPEKDEPINIVVKSESIFENGPPYITVKMTHEGVIIDFYQDGEISKSWARTYDEIWDDAL